MLDNPNSISNVAIAHVNIDKSGVLYREECVSTVSTSFELLST